MIKQSAFLPMVTVLTHLAHLQLTHMCFRSSLSLHLVLCLTLWSPKLFLRLYFYWTDPACRSLPSEWTIINTQFKTRHWEPLEFSAHFNAHCHCSFSAFIPWIGSHRINSNESVTGPEIHPCFAEDLLLLFPLRWKPPSLSVLPFALSLSTFCSVSLPLSLSLYLSLSLGFSTSPSVSLPLPRSLWLSLCLHTSL